MLALLACQRYQHRQILPTLQFRKRTLAIKISRNSAQPIPVPDASKLKPKLWERLAGAGVGFASGWGDAARGAQLGGDVTTRRYVTPKRDYTHQTGALDKQLEDARGGLGFAEAVGKIPQTDYENQMKRVEEIRRQKTGQGRIDEDEARMRRLQDQIDNPKGLSTNNHQESLAAASAAYAKGDQAEGDRLSKLAHDQLRIKRRGSRN